MKVLDGIRATGVQTISTFGFEGQEIKLKLYYIPATQRWKADIESGSFILNGVRLYHSPNIMVQYKNVVDFGIALIVNTDKGDPFLVNDFSSGRCQLYILSKEEVNSVEELIFEG